MGDQYLRPVEPRIHQSPPQLHHHHTVRFPAIRQQCCGIPTTRQLGNTRYTLEYSTAGYTFDLVEDAASEKWYMEAALLLCSMAALPSIYGRRCCHGVSCAPYSTTTARGSRNTVRIFVSSANFFVTLDEVSSLSFPLHRATLRKPDRDGTTRCWKHWYRRRHHDMDPRRTTTTTLCSPVCEREGCIIAVASPCASWFTTGPTHTSNVHAGSKDSRVH
jgi:hypothetical protein